MKNNCLIYTTHQIKKHNNLFQSHHYPSSTASDIIRASLAIEPQTPTSNDIFIRPPQTLGALLRKLSRFTTKNIHSLEPTTISFLVLSLSATK